MSANNKYTDKEFNEMMQEAFLDLDTGNPENSALLDEVAKSVYATEWAGVSDRHNAATVTKKNKVAMWAWFLSDIIIIVSVGIFGWNVLGNTEVKEEKTEGAAKEIAIAKPVQEKESNTEEKENSTIPVLSEKNSTENHGNSTVITEERHQFKEVKAVLSKADPKDITEKEKVSVNPAINTSTVTEDIANASNVISDDVNSTSSQNLQDGDNEDAAIPEFTEAETKEHLEAKEKFILSFTGMKKTEFALVDLPGETNGHRFLKTNEVSNFEYNMFLNDLIIKGKTKEYEIARHKNEKLYAGKDEMINKVFLNRYLKKSKYELEHKYKYYPVVCVSVEGMEMYCAWLKEQIQEYYKHNGQNVNVTVRLPKASEWKAAALNGNPKRKYATYNGKLTDDAAKSKWLANFVQTQNSYISGDENILLNRSDKSNKMKPTTLGKNMFTISSVTEGKDNKNETYGLQNMSGNVSEVVIDSDDETVKKYRTIGGNWNSKKKFLLIQSPDEFNGRTEPSIYVGFRPIVILEP